MTAFVHVHAVVSSHLFAWQAPTRDVCTKRPVRYYGTFTSTFLTMFEERFFLGLGHRSFSRMLREMINSSSPVGHWTLATIIQIYQNDVCLTERVSLPWVNYIESKTSLCPCPFQKGASCPHPPQDSTSTWKGSQETFWVSGCAFSHQKVDRCRQ